MLKKRNKYIFVDTGLKKRISSIAGSGITLTNKEIKGIIKVIRK